jgi:phospholipase C
MPAKGFLRKGFSRHRRFESTPILHTYYDQVSILKFIEKNWGLSPLTNRSRDNLQNPTTAAGNPYVPTNAPAIGDLMDMFDFNQS